MPIVDLEKGSCSIKILKIWKETIEQQKESNIIWRFNESNKIINVIILYICQI